MTQSDPRPDTALGRAIEHLGAVGRRGRLTPEGVPDVLTAWAEIEQADAIVSVSAHLPVLVRLLRLARAPDAAESMGIRGLPLLTGEAHALVALEIQSARLGQLLVAPELALAVQRALRHADEHLVAARFDRAADIVVRVNEAIFHRELHAEVERSPMVFDTKQFLAPLRESLTYQALVAPPGAFANQVAGEPPAPVAGPRPRGIRALLPPDTRRGRLARRLLGRPVRTARFEPEPARRDGATHVLALFNGPSHFSSPILDDLERQAGVEVRVVRLRDAKYPRRGHVEMIADRLAEATGRSRPALPSDVRASLEWADVVFVDWFDVAAQWACLHVPRSKRLVARLHSIEALSSQPHLVDYSRVSDLVFVGGHIRDLVRAAVPATQVVERTHVLPNAMHLDQFGLPKSPSAARTLALVGWAQQVKDPLWAVDLLSRLHAEDPRWRLLLIGADFNESLTASAYAYRDAFRARRQEPDLRDAIVEVGYRTDLPEVMRDVGFILSCSRRESFGIGLIEGAASGAVPIVRDWPMAKPFGGARRVFPDEWIVSSVAEAVDRIRTLDGPERELVGRSAREHALEHFDWPVVAPAYRALFARTPPDDDSGL